MALRSLALKTAIAVCDMQYWTSCWCHFVASTYSIIHTFIIYMYMHNMRETTQYWWSYASAKFRLDSCHRNIDLRRAISSSILVCWRRRLYWNVYHDSMYSLCDRGASKQKGQESRHDIVSWCKISYVYIHNTLTSPKHNIIPIFFNFIIAHVSISYRANYCVRSLRE